MPATVFATAAALIAVLVHLAWVLPRLGRAGAVASGTVGVLLGGAAAIRFGAWCVLPTVALAFGHIGWALHLRRATAETPVASRSAGSSTARTLPAPTIPASSIARTAAAGRAALGRYPIDREIGRGSMGVVYLGHDPQTDRLVALKTLALGKEFDGHELADARARFFAEAETARRLRHADIVEVFDAGEADGLAFIAMEYVDGDDLAAHTLPGRLLPVETVLATVERVARALAHAHRQGVVHRDIKPANLLIDAASGSVKVSDFGIARIADACRTRTGRLLGSPSFMSPEQMAGQRVDGRSDLYSLGVVLFQLLTGALPHRAESMGRLMYEIANEPAPDVRSLRSALPEPLARIVALALEKRSQLRYADGEQMANDLAALARTMPPASAKTGPSAAAATDPEPDPAPRAPRPAT